MRTRRYPVAVPLRTTASLCIAEAYPWPSVDGYRLRLANMIGGLLERGPVDFLCLDGSGRARDVAPDGVSVIDAPESPEHPMRTWMPAWVRSPDPRRLVRRDFSAARRVLPTLDWDRYDVTFFSHVDSWYQTHDLVRGPSLLDFDNLEDLLMAGIRRNGPEFAPDDGALARSKEAARWAIASGFDVVDERRWARIQRRAASFVDRVFVCSEIDIERSGCPNAVEVPNGYELAWTPGDHTDVLDRRRPVFVFVGLMGYQPNIDAARWFASEILPEIRRRIPEAEFRIVGRHAESVQSLGSLPGVTVVGAVDFLQPVLAGADVAVVPLRSGAGTRLKVVEAMANRLPIVTTSIGCEGIDVTDGEHVLVADDAASFAARCLEAATEQRVRAGLIESAAKRFDDRYQWMSIRSTVARLADEAAGQALRSSSR